MTASNLCKWRRSYITSLLFQTWWHITLLCASQFLMQGLFAQVPQFYPATEINVTGNNPTIFPNSPTVSPDEREIYFGHKFEIFRDVRDSPDESWKFDPVEFVESLSFGARDHSPKFLPDGLTMVLSHDGKAYEARRRTVNHDWTEFKTIGIEDDRGIEIRVMDPSLSADKRSLYFTSNFFSRNNAEIRVVTRDDTDEMFIGPGRLLDEINTVGRRDSTPHISDDGLTLYFASDRDGGFGGEDIWMAIRDSIHDDFGPPIVLGPEINTPETEQAPFVALDGTLYFYRDFGVERCCSTLFKAEPFVLGDFDADGMLTVGDLTLLAAAMHEQPVNLDFDLNEDKFVDVGDLRRWVTDLKNTYIGDANLDGEFNSRDLTDVFQIDKFEKGESATWSEGDWNGDSVFDSKDFVVAFQDGGYERGPRAEVSAVPEPTSALLLVAGLVGIAIRQRHVIRRNRF